MPACQDRDFRTSPEGVQVWYSRDTRPRRGQFYAAGLTAFLAFFFRAGDFFGIPALKTS